MTQAGAAAYCAAVYAGKVRRLRGLLDEVRASGVEQDDPRIGYVTVRIDRETWDALNVLDNRPSSA